MPALPNVSKVVRLDLNFTLAGSVPARTRQFWRYSGSAPNNTEMLAFCDNAVAGWAANMQSLMSSDYQFISAEGTDLSSPTAAQAISLDTLGGARSGNTMPQDVAAVVRYQIARRYRGGHPRGYWPSGVDEDLQDERSWKTAFLTDHDTGVLGFSTAMTGAGWSGAGTIDQVNVSYYHLFDVQISPGTGRARNVPRLRGAPVVDAVVQFATQPVLGTQRKRLGR